MSGPLVATSVLQAAYQRLIALHGNLHRKIEAAPNTATNLEYRVRFLAEKALAMLRASPHIESGSSAPELAQVSRYAVMGSAGANVLAATSALGQGRDWVYLTLRKGTPDENRERILAQSSDFALKLWDRLSTHVTSDADMQARMQAYVLGYLCSLANAVVCNPFIDDYEWRLGPGRTSRPSLTGGVRSMLDARAALEDLGAGSPREGQNWSGFWPEPNELPEFFWPSFQQAFTDIYGATPGVGSRQFEDAQVAVPRAPLSMELLRDGYEFYYHGVIGIQYGFDYWKWIGFFLPMSLTLFLELALAPAFPRWRAMFTKIPSKLSPDGVDEDTLEASTDGRLAWVDLFAYPLLMTGPAMLTYAIYAHTVTNRSVGGLNVWAIVVGALITVLLIIYLATIDTKGKDFPPWLRALLFVVLPLIGPIVFLILRIVKGGTPLGSLSFLYSMPFFGMLVGVIAYFIYFLPLGALAKEAGAGDTALALLYALLFAPLALFGLIMAWLAASRAMRNAMLPEMADEQFADRRRQVVTSRFPTDRPGFARLFDEATLFQLGADAAASPIAASVERTRQYYPSARRQLIKLWWTAEAGNSGTLHVRSDRYALTFAGNAAGTGTTSVVPAPLGAATVAEYVASINGLAVIQVGSVQARLHAAPVFATDFDYELPPGATFSDHGDHEATTEAHDLAAARFMPVGTTENAPDVYTLYHAPKVAQSVRFGQNGPVPSDIRDAVPADVPQNRNIPGEGTVRTAGAIVTGTGSVFAEFFVVGDTLVIGGQKRIITLIRSQTELVVESTFNPSIAADTAYARLGGDLERQQGFDFARSTGGGAPRLIDIAGDLAAILCMAAVPKLRPGDHTIPGLSGSPGGDQVSSIGQVFRNWNLDRRRVNEWRELVAGQALPERPQDFGAYGPAPAAAVDPVNYPAWRRAGADLTQQLGWVPLLKKFMEVAAVPGTDFTNAVGTPSPQGVARAIAHLLDLPEPQTAH